MTPDHFDVFGTDHEFDDDGSTSDYWDAYVAAAETFAITVDTDELPFLLTDSELAELSSDVDVIPADEWEDAIADPTIIAPF